LYGIRAGNTVLLHVRLARTKDYYNKKKNTNEEISCHFMIFTGDLELDRPASHNVCVENIKDFTSCFLFSLETQHTIG
jgi:Inward rectifier potassium channel transmembrane domain